MTTATSAPVSGSYTARYEWFAEQEQLLVDQGDYGKAKTYHEAALALLWALTAEEDNPVPPGLRGTNGPPCSICHGARVCDLAVFG